MSKYALIGKSLAHSQSARIHSLIGDYQYTYVEVGEASELEAILRNPEYDGFNVTLPYKGEVMQYLDELSDIARRVGAVNTIKRLPDGRLKGYNTDYTGFRYTVIGRVEDRKCLVLGTGGAARSCAECLADLGAREIILVSRNPEQVADDLRSRFTIASYDRLHRHYDAEVMINATPVGMSPDIDRSPLSEYRITARMFINLELAVDLIYNPYRTKFLQDARRLTRCHTKSGLDMLIVQALESGNIWVKGEAGRLGATKKAGLVADVQDVQRLVTTIKKIILEQQLNLIAIGMPGSGKTTIFRRYAYELGRDFIDTDALTEELMGDTIQNVLATGEMGIEYFRQMEHEALKEACKHVGAVIATGGGTVLNPLNRDLLRSNGIVVYMKRPLDLLAVEGRPLSANNGVSKLFGERDRIYRSVSDLSVINARIFGNANNYNHDLKGFVYYIARKIQRHLDEIADNQWT